MKYILLLAAVISVFSVSAEESITVWRKGIDFFVRSKYSETEDLIIQTWRYANERAYLVKRGTPIKDYRKGKLLHTSGDDYPAVAPMGNYGTLSGNHGSPFTRCLTVPNHGMTAKDIGNIIKDRRQNPFIILKILDKNNILIHSEGKPDTLKVGFIRHSRAPLFYKGKKLPFTKSVMRQLYPLNRVTDWQLLADGTTPIPENKEVKCRFVDFIFVHDVVNVYHFIQAIRKDPAFKQIPEPQIRGKMCFVNTPALQKKYASYMKLPALATYANKIRFQARGARVNYRKTTYHAALSHTNNLDVMMGWAGLIAKQDRQFFYIPKLKPLTISDRVTREKRTLDLTAGIQIPIKMNYSYRISLKDVKDPKDLPDRFIRITGNEKKYLYGVALGYSLLEGRTARKNMPGDRTTLYHLYRTNKMYPYSGTTRNIRPGQTEEVVAYHQYFNPQLEPDATSFYCHYQRNSLMVYLDFHKKLKNKKIKLPASAAGRVITVVEKTPGMTLQTKGKVPASGIITLSNGTTHGYLVLKLD